MTDDLFAVQRALLLSVRGLEEAKHGPHVLLLVSGPCVGECIDTRQRQAPSEQNGPTESEMCSLNKSSEDGSDDYLVPADASTRACTVISSSMEIVKWVARQ